MSQTTIEQAVRQDLVPSCGRGGRGNAHHFDFNALQQFAVAGACVSVGMTPLSSLQFASALFRLFQHDAGKDNIAYGEASLWRASMKPVKGFGLFSALQEEGRLPQALAELDKRKADSIVEIYQRKYAFLFNQRLSNPDPHHDSAIIIHGWERGSPEVSATTVMETVNHDIEAANALSLQMDIVRNESDSFIRINVGRAIRRAAAHIAEKRSAGAP